MSHNYYNKNLTAYCHYPLVLAEQELEHSQNDMYRITTINWAVATSEILGTVDSEHVYKNVYEMTLGEFLEWIRDMDEGGESIVSIEKITNIKF
ncbi:MAG: hypothetical protein FVQ82_02905 [Planctomycetes bacterium]|nr:hypothetical protein [Planctomycetota bacterium]